MNEETEAKLNAEILELRAALEVARKTLVTACGDKAPYVRVALDRIDGALRAGEAALRSR
jgi:hypothetical protein